MLTLSIFFKHLLLPGYSNNQKAKLLHNESILLLTLMLILGQYLFNFFPRIGVNVLGYASQISTDEVIKLTNEERSKLGMSELKYSPLLTQAAKAKGEDMLVKDYWAHVAPDGTQPWKFFNDVGYKYRYAGENLAKDFPTPQAAIDAWMASPSHRDNLLSSKYDEIGIAVVEGDLSGEDTTIIVQLFGKRYDTTVASATTTVSAKTDSVKNSETVVPEASINIQSITPTLIPTPTTFIQKVAVNENATETNAKPTPLQVLVSPFSTRKGFSAAATSVLLVTFVADGMFLAKKKITRVGGRTFAHILFLSMILIIIVLVQRGDILLPVSDIAK